jgi:hypothetical protein
LPAGAGAGAGVASPKNAATSAAETASTIMLFRTAPSGSILDMRLYFANLGRSRASAAAAGSGEAGADAAGSGEAGADAAGAGAADADGAGADGADADADIGVPALMAAAVGRGGIGTGMPAHRHTPMSHCRIDDSSGAATSSSSAA